ncbi:colipase-like protein 2 [Mirounga leonina]|uniref:colipase-like protein 2 n=1 Tax=Mirounga leonina TaxID=9715 RepID=UPI00156C3827|nr:colipase-like protein 2 [Mirounga leonina]
MTLEASLPDDAATRRKRGLLSHIRFYMSARELVTRELSPQVNGAECSHHSECSSDCCLIDLDGAGAFCAPKARIAMLCLFQTKGAINIICPCQSGLSCISKDPGCSRRCHLI